MYGTSDEGVAIQLADIDTHLRTEEHNLPVAGRGLQDLSLSYFMTRFSGVCIMK